MMQHQLHHARASRPHGSVVVTALFLVTISAISVHKIWKGLMDESTAAKNDQDHHDEKEENNDETDTDSKDKENHIKYNSPSRHGHGWYDHLPSHIQREQMKERRRKEKIPMLALKSKLYDNITMLDPQGQILCKISRKKARWYVQKNLAEWKREETNINDTANDTANPNTNANNANANTNANTIQLKFEPKARSTDHDYGKRTKKNVCVACGDAEKHQMRFYIVPHVYRNLFPKKYKTHMSHDVVLLCSDCHLICGQASNIRMNELEERFHPQKKYHVDHELYKMRSSAMALMNWRQKLPLSQIEHHESNVRLYFDKKKMVMNGGKMSISNSDETFSGVITKEQLQKVIHVDYRIQNPNYIPGPELVVNSMVNNHEAMSDFIKGWREFFLETIHPRHLPKGWSIHYPITCDES